MGWITILLKLAAALPQIITIVLEIIKLINGLQGRAARKMAQKELLEAIEMAKKIKSSKPVEELYERLKQGNLSA